MFPSLNKRRRRRLDKATSCVRRPRSRRLMIEIMESRLLLSGNQLNDSIYNLDSFQDYAVISQGNAQPTESSSSASAIPSPSQFSTTFNDVAPVTIAPIPLFTNGAGYTTSRGDVHTLVGTSQLFGVPALDVSVPSAWDSFFDGAGIIIVTVSDTGLDTLQLVNSNSDYLSDYLYRFNGTSASGLLGGSVTDMLLGSKTNLIYRDVQQVLVRGLGETPHVDVDAAVSDYLAWSASPWLSELGSTVVDHSWDAVNNGQFTAGDDVPAFVPSIDAVVFNEPRGTVASENNNSQGHVTISGQLPRTGLVGKVPNSQSEAKLAEAIGDLLAHDTILVDYSSATGSDGTSVADNHQVLTTTESTQPNGEMPVAGTVVVATLGGSTEGGMISVEALIDVACHAATASADEHASVAGNATPIVGELTRVAVMELIEGPADPAAPQPAAQQMLLATDQGTDVLRNATDHRSSKQTSTQSAIKILAEQAGLVAATIAPVNSFNVATIVSAVGDAFASAALSLPSETLARAERDGDASGAARSEAFSQWNDRQNGSGAAAHDNSNGWLDAVPLLTILACERVVASKSRRQQQRPPIGKPATPK